MNIKLVSLATRVCEGNICRSMGECVVVPSDVSLEPTRATRISLRLLIAALFLTPLYLCLSLSHCLSFSLSFCLSLSLSCCLSLAISLVWGSLP
jgi:hypothetical protein